MARETDEEKAERRRRAGRRLRGWRDAARINQRDMADHLGIWQQTLSQYERGTLQIPYEYAPEIARILKMDEPDVWRGLEFPLPEAWRTNRGLKAWARREWGDVVTEVLGERPGPNPTSPGDKSDTRARSGEKRRPETPGQESAV